MKTIIYGTGHLAAQLTTRLSRTVDYYVPAFPEEEAVVTGPMQPLDTLRQEDRDDVMVFVASDPYHRALFLLEDMGFTEYVNLFNGSPYTHMPSYGAESGVMPLTDGFVAKRGVDPTCKLFEKPGTPAIYRGVFPSYEEHFRRIYDICVEHHLFEDGLLIPTHISSLQVPPFSLVFEHVYIPNVTYCHEWSFLMMRDAALSFLELLRRVSRAGLGLKDGHAFNATFFRGKFVWLDFGSLLPHPTPAYAVAEFISTYINVLLLERRNFYKKGVRMLRNLEDWITFADIKGYMSDAEQADYKRRYRQSLTCALDGDLEACCAVLEEWVHSASNIFRYTSFWETYYDTRSPFDQDYDTMSIKQRTVLQMARQVSPKTLLDVAGNSGWYTFQLCRSVERCVLTDIDTQCIDDAYEMIKKHQVTNVVPLVQNFVTPSLAQSNNTPIDTGHIYRWRESAACRLKSECVMALALIHHLVFLQMMTFPEIVGQLSEFTTKYLLIEYIDRSDVHLQPWLGEKFDWYTRENFDLAIQDRFTILDVRSTSEEGSRFAYLCELKQSTPPAERGFWKRLMKTPK